MNAPLAKSARQKARESWGREMPEWIDALARACDDSSQSRIASRLGYSQSVISQVLKRTYRGSLAAVEQKVRGALMNEVIDCPVMGELRRDQCIDHQRKVQKRVIGTSSWRSRLYRTCPTCPHATITGES